MIGSRCADQNRKLFQFCTAALKRNATKGLNCAIIARRDTARVGGLGVSWELGSVLLETAVLLATLLAIELVAPLYKVTWSSRLLGVQLTLVKAAAAVLLVPVLYKAWAIIGVQPIELGIGFGHSFAGVVAGIACVVLVSDFLGYWHHRFLHRFFWPVHATHHAIRELSALNAYAHFGEKITQFLIMVVPLSVIEWDSPVVPAAIVLAVTWAEYWIHSPTTAQMSGLRHVFVTPRFHRIHHSLESQHFDKNFGILFSFWDRLFGTAFIPAPDEWPETGLADRTEAGSIAEYLVYPLRFRRQPAQPGDDRNRPNLIPH